MNSTAEFSLYLREGFRGKKIGQRLWKAILAEATSKPRFHSIIGLVTTENTASLAFCKSQGFRHVGTWQQVGKKFGRLLDVAIFEMIIRPTA